MSGGERRLRGGKLLALVAAWVAVPGVANAELSIEDLQAQIDALFGRAVPVGTVVPFTGDPAFLPEGFLLCDGSEVSRVDFSELFAVMGTSHGAGDGSTTFHLPDYRGRFLRGVDGGAGRDPDAAGRAPMNPGGNTGDAVGTLQADASDLSGFSISSGGYHVHSLASGGLHKHDITDLVVRGSEKGDRDGTRYLVDASSGTAFADASARHAHTTSLTGAHDHAITGGDSETRPVNAYVHWIIKH